MSELIETRRRFMAYFASVGLGTTLAPGVVWARMQDAGSKTITLEMVTEAMKLSGIELTEAGRSLLGKAPPTVQVSLIAGLRRMAPEKRDQLARLMHEWLKAAGMDLSEAPPMLMEDDA